MAGAGRAPAAATAFAPMPAYGACNWLVAAEQRRDTSARPAATTAPFPISSHAGQSGALAQDRDSPSTGCSTRCCKLRLPLTTRPEDPSTASPSISWPLPPAHSRRRPVMTGHDNGLITINLAEADDAERERMRDAHGRALSHVARSFPPRDRPLLLGPAGREHAGHRRVPRTCSATSARITARRCKRHYANGPPPDWPERFVTAYASTHPWEDFAETWAHYFHMVDTLETAARLRAAGSPARDQGRRPVDARSTSIPTAPTWTASSTAWLPLTFAVNSINRSMGLRGPLSVRPAPPVIVKLSFVHDRIHAAGGPQPRDAARNALRAIIAGLKRTVGAPQSA